MAAKMLAILQWSGGARPAGAGIRAAINLQTQKSTSAQWVLESTAAQDRVAPPRHSFLDGHHSILQ
jgi:hypothetical protein